MNLNFRNLFQRDIDQVFSYKTDIEVVILDRYVGMIFRIFQLLIIAYFLYSNITGSSGVIKNNFSKGVSVVEIAGSGLSSEGDLFDEMDIIEPEVYSDSIFLATSVSITTEKKDSCVDPSLPCIKDNDCKKLFKDQCVNGSCSGFRWCAQKNNVVTTVKYDIGQNLLIWIRSYIQFAQFESSPSYFSSFYSNDPYFKTEKVNVYSINDLLRYSPDLISYPSLKETGGILKVTLFWKCYIFSTCEPELIVRRLDMQESEALIGYNSVKYSIRKTSSGDLQRTVHNMTGIRLIFTTEGIGNRISFENIVYQIANFVSLMLIPKLLADFILIYVLKYEDYSAYKYENPINKKNLDESDDVPLEETKKEDRKKEKYDEDEEDEEEKEDGEKQQKDEGDELLKDLDSP